VDDPTPETQSPQEASQAIAAPGLTVEIPNYAEACIGYCPQLHRCVNSALIRLAMDGGELKERMNTEIQLARERGELPRICEVGPTQVSSHTTRSGGAPVRLADLRASTFWGVDPWDHEVATVCQMDREKLVKGRRLNAPWERDDYRTGMFDGELRREFYHKPR
jgi:hypothetical protein